MLKFILRAEKKRMYECGKNFQINALDCGKNAHCMTYQSSVYLNRDGTKSLTIQITSTEIKTYLFSLVLYIWYFVASYKICIVQHCAMRAK